MPVRGCSLPGQAGVVLGCLMAAAANAPSVEPESVHPVIAALRRAPIVRRLTPEQRAELDQQIEDIRAGRARLVRHEDVPAALEEIHRAEHGE